MDGGFGGGEADTSEPDDRSAVGRLLSEITPLGWSFVSAGAVGVVALAVRRLRSRRRRADRRRAGEPGTPR